MYAHNITNLNPTTLILLPVGFILYPFAIYAFVNEVLKDFKLESILGISYLLIYYSYTKFVQIGYVAAFAIPIVLHFTVCMQKIMKQENTKKYIILACLEILYLVGVWHSAAFYAIVLFGAITIVYFVAVILFVLIRRRKRKTSSKHSFLNTNVALFAIITISLISIFTLNVKSDLLSGYLDLITSRFFSEEGFAVGILNVFTPLVSRLLGKSDLPLAEELFEYNYVTTTAGKIYFVAHIIIHIIAFFMVLFSVISLFVRIKRDPNSKQMIWLVIGISLILAQIIYYLLYSATGSNLFFVSIMFPIFGVLLLNKISKKKLATISLGSILVLSTIMSFTSISSNQFGYNVSSRYEDNINGFQWLNENFNETNVLLFDFNLYSRFLQYNTENNLNISQIISYINSQNYQYITGTERPPNSYNNKTIVIFDLLTLNDRIAFDTYENRGLLISRLDLINSNPYLSLIYNDGRVGIYSFI